MIDFPRRDLWAAVPQDGQRFINEQHMHPIDSGPGLAFTSLIPDVDHFNGRGGHVFPLLHPDESHNVASGLLNQLEQTLGLSVTAQDLAAYIAAVTAHPAFTARFADELVTPGIRVPITADPELWSTACDVGRQLVWAATYGEAFADPAQGHPQGKIGFAPDDPRRPMNLSPMGTGMPQTITNLPSEAGEGRFGLARASSARSP